MPDTRLRTLLISWTANGALRYSTRTVPDDALTRLLSDATHWSEPGEPEVRIQYADEGQVQEVKVRLSPDDRAAWLDRAMTLMEQVVQ